MSMGGGASSERATHIFHRESVAVIAEGRSLPIARARERDMRPLAHPIAAERRSVASHWSCGGRQTPWCRYIAKGTRTLHRRCRVDPIQGPSAHPVSRSATPAGLPPVRCASAKSGRKRA